MNRPFIAQTRQALVELMQRTLSGQRYPVQMLDGIEMDDHMVIAALGVDGEGRKRVME